MYDAVLEAVSGVDGLARGPATAWSPDPVDALAAEVAEVCGIRRHHRLLHRGELSVTGNADDPGGLEFRDWDRRLLDAVGRPRPPVRPPDQAARSAGIPTPTY